jgi:glutamyl-tRNA synthetase
VEQSTENLHNVLEWAELYPDEGPIRGGDFGPYYQSQRLDVYQKHADYLLEKGYAYIAFDTPDELEKMRKIQQEKGRSSQTYNFLTRSSMRNSLTLSKSEVQDELNKGKPYVYRLYVPADRKFQFNDKVRGDVQFDSQQIDDQVLIKSDGFPTYHLANVIDDHLMQITHIIRGEEWLSSTPKHILLYNYFGWKIPEMAHLPLIFNPDGSKMSKRNIQSFENPPEGRVDPDVRSYIKKGYEKSALINYIALLGWNPGEGDDRQIFTLEELVEEFSLERVNKASAIFDLKKLNWINKEHLSRKPSMDYLIYFKNELQKSNYEVPSNDYLLKIIDLLKSRIYFKDDLIVYSSYFFKDPDTYDEKTVRKRWKNKSKNLLLEYCDEISKLETTDASSYERTLRKVAEKNKVGAGQIIHPVRLTVTGYGVGPGLFEILQLLDRDAIIRRIEKGIKRLSNSG